MIDLKELRKHAEVGLATIDEVLALLDVIEVMRGALEEITNLTWNYEPPHDPSWIAATKALAEVRGRVT